jgi:hypothetical protein
MGYKRFSVEAFSSRFCPRERAVETMAAQFGRWKGVDYAWGKPNSISDFLQEIADS